MMINQLLLGPYSLASLQIRTFKLFIVEKPNTEQKERKDGLILSSVVSSSIDEVIENTKTLSQTN